MNKKHSFSPVEFSMNLLKNQTKFTDKELKELKSDYEFMRIAVDLLIEIAEITTFLSSVHPLDKNYKPRIWNRNEAILAGLMVRIVKLQIEVLDANKRLKLESVQIFFRCLSESVINLIFLSSKSDSNLFNQFVAHSLKGEKELLEVIQKNIKARNGKVLPIEERMQRSILKSFKQSMMKPEDVDSKKRSEWNSLTLFQRAKAINLEYQYIAAFALPCHEVHGNWEDLIRYHLQVEGEGFIPITESKPSKPQVIIAAAQFSAYACWEYLNLLPDCDERTGLKVRIEEVIEKCRRLDSFHEKYVQDKGNVGS